MFSLRHRELDYTLYKGDGLISKYLAHGMEWEPHLLTIMEKFIKQDHVCLDIGSNFGYHALEMSKLTKNMVHAFEPQHENFLLLKKNVENNKIQNITIYENAVGNSTTTVKMPLFNIENEDVCLNMGDISVNHLQQDQKFTEVKTVKIDDLLLDRVDFVKIDVQGYEQFVLNGMATTLSVHKPLMVIEFEDHQLLKFGYNSLYLFNILREMGYTLFLIDADYASDHLCVPNDKLEFFLQEMKEFIVFNDKQSNRICPSINGLITQKIKS